VAERPCYGFARSSVENAMQIPDGCKPCAEHMVRSLVQDAMLDEVPLPAIIDESQAYGTRLKEECVATVTESGANIVRAAECGRVALSSGH
jgi:ABC-type branched-subunit amino acid transport system substrate-binding protein